MALGVTVPRAADNGGLRWGRDPAVIAAPPPLSGLGRGSRTAPLGTTLGQGRASACARRERDGGRPAGQGQERGRAALGGGGEPEPSGPACPEGRGVGAVPPRRGCGRRRRRPPAAPPPPELQPVRAGRGPPAAPRCGAAPATRGRLRAPAPRAARPQVTGPRPALRAGGQRGGGGRTEPPQGPLPPVRPGPARPRSAVGAAPGRGRQGQAGDPGRFCAVSGERLREKERERIVPPTRGERIPCGAHRRPPLGEAVVPPGVPCWRLVGTGRCATSAPGADTWQRVLVAIGVCVPIAGARRPRVCPLRAPRGTPAAAPERGTVARPCVPSARPGRPSVTSRSASVTARASASRRDRPAAGRRQCVTRSCGLAPEGVGRGERGAIRGRPPPRRPWPRGTGGLREQMLKGSLAGCDA